MSEINREKLKKLLKRYSYNDAGQTLNFMINDINGCVVFIEAFIDEIIEAVQEEGKK